MTACTQQSSAVKAKHLQHFLSALGDSFNLQRASSDSGADTISEPFFGENLLKELQTAYFRDMK